jgi:hypothetical protein
MACRVILVVHKTSAHVHERVLAPSMTFCASRNILTIKECVVVIGRCVARLAFNFETCTLQTPRCNVSCMYHFCHNS